MKNFCSSTNCIKITRINLIIFLISIISIIPQNIYANNYFQDISLISGGSGSGNGLKYNSSVSSALLVFAENGTGNNYLHKSADDQVIVYLSGYSNPVANAGEDQIVNENSLVMLNASNSYVPAGSITSYLWTQIDGIQVELSDNTSVTPTFITPEISPSGEILIFQLQVTNSIGQKSYDQVKIHILNVQKHFTITAIAETGGTISPTNEINILEDESQLFNIYPDTGYDVSDVIVDGKSVGSVEKYAFNSVKADHIIKVFFAIKPVITASSGKHGVIEPTGKIETKYGADQYFLFIPEEGFRVADVIIDGTSLGPSQFYYFSNIFENHTIAVIFEQNLFTINASSGENGNFIPEGQISVSKDNDQTFKIVPDYGFEIDTLIVNSQKIDPVSSYTFFRVSSNHDIYVSFKSKPKINALSGVNGKIDPSGEIIVNRGSYKVFNITADPGFRVDNLIVDGISLGMISKYEFTDINQDHTIYAIFKKAENAFVINLLADEGGSFSPVGKDGLIEAELGIDKIIKIIPDNGYIIKDVLVDYISQGIINEYEFKEISQDHVISASFEQIWPAVQASIIGNGKIIPQGKILVEPGNYQSFTIEPDFGHQVTDVIIDNESMGQIDYYYFTDVNEDHSITAHIEPALIVIEASAGENGDISPSGQVQVLKESNQIFIFKPETGYDVDSVYINDKLVGSFPDFTFWYVTHSQKIYVTFKKKPLIEAVSGENGNIEPSGNVYVNTGNYQQFFINPDTGYAIDDVVVDGISIGPQKNYIFWNVNSNHTISALFKKYVINAKTPLNGKIEPMGVTNAAPLSNITYNIIPDTGFIIKNVLVDSNSVGALNLYTFWEIEKDHTIEASFEALPKYDILISSNTGGTINPNGENNKLTFYAGDFPEFEISPDYGYKLEKLLVDNASISPRNFYIFRNISSDHSIQAEFKEIPKYTITATAGIGGSLSPLGQIKIFEGNIINFKVINNEGYRIKDIIVDNESKGKLTSFPFIVFEDHTIHAEFEDIITRKISGNVKDQDNNPVYNYIVEAWDNFEFLNSTLTDEYGQYTITDIIPSDNIIVSVWPDNTKAVYEGQYYSNKTSRTGANKISTIDDNQSQIDFILTKASKAGFKGKVIKSTNNLSDIIVDIYSYESGFTSSSQTDESGFYTFTGLNPQNSYIVSVWSDEINSDFYYTIPPDEHPGLYIPVSSTLTKENASFVSPSEPLISNINIFIDKDQGAFIKGHVYNITNNKPLDNIWVNAWSNALNTGAGAFTDSFGAYTITGLESVHINESQSKGYIVEIRSSIYKYQTYISDVDSSNMVEASKENVDFFLSPYSTISGTIIDNYGNPVQGAQVSTKSLSNPDQFQGNTISDESGNYTISDLLIADDYIVYAAKDNYPLSYYKDHNNDDIKTTINIASNNNQINIILDKGPTISGTIFILNSQTPANQVINVNIWSQSTNTGGIVETDENGNYEISGLIDTCNDYIISVRYSDYMPSFYRDNFDDNNNNDTVYDWEKASGVAPSQIKRNIILIKGFELKGLITDNNNNPINGIKIKAVSEEVGGWKSIESNSQQNINYIITGLIPGIYNIYVQSSNYEDQIIQTNISEISNILNINLNKPSKEISGLITGLKKDQEVFLNAWSASNDFKKSIRITGTGDTIEYKIPELKSANDYILEIISDQKPSQYYSNKTLWEKADLIDLTQNNQSGIDFRLDLYETCQISGNIVFPENAIANESVIVEAYSLKNKYSGAQNITFQSKVNMPFLISNLICSDDYILITKSDIYSSMYYNNVYNLENAIIIDTENEQTEPINIYLNKARSVSGYIIANDDSIVNEAEIEAFSSSNGTLGFGLPDKDGFYKINGLCICDDIVIRVFIKDIGTYYFNKDQITKDSNLATLLTTKASNLSNINFAFSENSSIKGRVIDEMGFAVSGIWIDAWSESVKFGNGAFSDNNGFYEIKALKNAIDYKLSAIPDSKAAYLKQAQENIKTGSVNINFILVKKHGVRLSGLVINEKGEPIPEVKIELRSQSDPDIYIWDISNSSGNYTLSNIAVISDYAFSASPLPSQEYAHFSKYNFNVSKNLTYNIILSPGQKFFGRIESDISPIAGARISIYSQKQNFQNETTSDNDGFYEIPNVPVSSDYKISAISDNFLQIEKYDLCPGIACDLKLERAASISGQIKEAKTGTPVMGVRVEIFSKAYEGVDSYNGVGITDKEGLYEIKGIKQNDPNGQLLQDYVVNAYAPNYPPLSKGSKKAYDKVDFLLSSGLNNEINGQITPAPVNTVIIDLFENDGEYVQSFTVDSGKISINGLNPVKQYHLNFKEYENNNVINDQWAGINDMGVSLRDAAKSYKPGDGIIFRFSETSYKTIKKYSGPGPVQNLRSSTHFYRNVSPKGRTIISTQGPETISNNPEITVNWEPPVDDQENIKGYYHTFSDSSDLKFDKINTAGKSPIKTRKITSESIKGDDLSYYFYVAPIDKEGRLGPTTSIAFRIDTIPPTNPSVIAPELTNISNINLTLGATGASEMFISNLGYKDGGIWENKLTNKKWKILGSEGKKKIYVRYRDRAGNTANSSAVTKFQPDDTYYTIDVTSGENGSLSPSGIVQVKKGENQTVLFQPDEGYKVKRIIIDSKAQNLNITKYSFTNIEKDHAIEVSFEKIIHTISISSGNNGTVMPSGMQNVSDASDLTININPNSGYTVSKITLDGKLVNDFQIPYVFNNITQSHSLVIDFEKSHEIKASCGKNGTIEPYGIFQTAHGSIVSVKITPDLGYDVENVLLDGNPVELNGDRYTFLNVVDSHEISASFKQASYKIIVIKGSNGSVSPEGEIIVPGGLNKIFTFNPSPGYEINKVMVDSIPVEISNNSYTFEKISRDHTIAVNFRLFNHAPVADDLSITTDEDHEKTAVLNAVDQNIYDKLTFIIVSEPQKGNVILDQNTGSFVYQPDINEVGTDFFTYKVNDGIYDSDTKKVEINIININDPPAAKSFLFSLDEDTISTSYLKAEDIDSDELIYSIYQSPEMGSLTLVNSETGEFVYKPDKDFYGDDSFSFKVNDKYLDSSKAIVSIKVNPRPDPPVAYKSSFSLIEDVPKYYTLTAFDPDNDPLSYTLVSNGTKGQVSIVDPLNGVIMYTPKPDISGLDNFTFKVSDQEYISEPAEVIVTIIPVNDKPKAIAQNIELEMNNEFQITLIATDAENDALDYIIIDDPLYGEISGILPEIIYTPHENYLGVDSFTFRAIDKYAASETTEIKIRILAPSDESCDEDTSVDIHLCENCQISKLPLNGSISGAPPDYTYIPFENFNGLDDLYYSVDNQEKKISIYVKPVNDSPYILSQPDINTTEGQNVTIELSGVDIDGDRLYYEIINMPSHGSISGEAPYMTYVPHPNYNGTDSFSYKVNDGFLSSEIMTVNINIGSVNDAPEAKDQTVSTNEDSPIQIILKAVDIEGDPLEYFITEKPLHGYLSGNPPEITYNPDNNYSGKDQFTFIANDSLQDSNSGIVTIFVSSSNDPPQAYNSSIELFEDTTAEGILSASDTDSLSLIYKISKQGSKGSASITNPQKGLFTYKPYPDTTGEDEILFVASDGYYDSEPAKISVFIKPVNDAPQAYDGVAETIEEMPLDYTLKAYDIDSTYLNFSITSYPQKGSIILTDTIKGSFKYIPYEDKTGFDQFSFIVTDGEKNSNKATMIITIISVNDPPQAFDKNITTNEDVSFKGLIIGEDKDNDSLNFILVENGTKGSLDITNPKTGEFEYLPFSNEYGQDIVKFKVNDSHLDSNIASIYITINPINDPPVAYGNDSVQTNENTMVKIYPVANDIDGDELSFQIQTQGFHGTAVCDNSTIKYTPDSNFWGYDSFTYKAFDGLLYSNAATIKVWIGVNPANIITSEDVPVFINILKGAEIVKYPDNGQLYGEAPELIYTPDLNYSGSDRISYKNPGSDDIINIEIFIKPVNDPPIIEAYDQIKINEDTNVQISLNIFDPEDDLESLTYSVITQPTHGIISTNMQYINYTPVSNYNGDDSFIYSVSDNSNVESTKITINIEISPINDPPIIEEMSLITIEEKDLSFMLKATDVENQHIIFTIVEPPLYGTLQNNGANCIYTPNKDFSGSDILKFKASDGIDDSIIGLVIINVTNVNDAPQAYDLAISASPGQSKVYEVEVYDPDKDILSASIISLPKQGSVNFINPVFGPSNDIIKVSFLYSPDSNATGFDSFSYKISDGKLTSDFAIVSISFDSDPINEKYQLYVNLAGDYIDNDIYYYKIIDSKTGAIVAQGSKKISSFIENLSPSTYDIEISATGYQTVKEMNFQLYENSDLSINMQEIDNIEAKLTVQLKGEYQTNTMYKYSLINSDTGAAVNESKNTDSFSKILECGRYRLLIIADNYKPFEYSSGGSKNINLYNDLKIEVELEKGNFSIGPVLDISHTENTQGFTLRVIKSNFNDAMLVKIDDIPINNPTNYDSYVYKWNIDNPFVDPVFDYPDIGDTTYNICFKFYDGETYISDYSVTYITYNSEQHKESSKSQTQKDFEQLYANKTDYITFGQQIFSPLAGTNFQVILKTSEGKDYPAQINIPPIPLDYLYIDDSDISLDIQTTDNLKYNSSSDRYNINIYDSGLKRIEPEDKLLIKLIHYTFGGDSLASGVNISFEAASGKYKGLKVKYNPYAGTNNKRINEITNEQSPFITLPILLNPDSSLYLPFIQELEKMDLLKVLIEEKGDGIPGFNDEKVSFALKNDLIMIKTNHLTSVAIDFKPDQPSVPLTPSSDSGGGCFIDILSYEKF